MSSKLLNISDFTFEFFKTSELFCRERLTHNRLVDMGQFSFRVVKDEVITDYELFQAWVNCVTNSRPLCQIEADTSDKVSGFFVEAINSSYDEHKEIKMFISH
jgi:hypothetical protein